ncbi:dinitrogenase iron-molybdenum cofactor biosynthesis protein [Desulfobacteraceae bacterium SEEP-SAG9]|nr:dinitrogenase iron-molybdenum cofactor biosynthesis protein [Desulfobacteraceae bacterium SEEP-SAG9]
MKVAITSSGKDLTSEVDPRFGRAAYFIIIDPETMENEVVANTQNLNLAQGAGIQAGKTIVDNNVDVVITGNCGPKAFRVLQSANIKTITGVSGRIVDVIARFKDGTLQAAQQPNVEGHWV